MGQLVAAAPRLAAEALAHLAQALVGDGDEDVRRDAATAMGQLVAAAPGLAAEALAHWAQASGSDGDGDTLQHDIAGGFI